ncbi:uncharacterized protein LOC119549588 [Drosophila subpulchrella]|uniref:uncharacterized protein LOC119549588 n=1 Tax=Drosophila subpulchrella TaxID=1486046 RepID=UPI0018A16E44|nr:uncharacterized protein LOC119549588 [Drosophila subpulchrella]
MPTFFQAISKSTLHPTVRDKHKMFLGHACPFFSSAGKISRAENHYSLLRINNEKSEMPLIKRMEHLQKGMFSSGVKSCNAQIEMPKWKRFKNHIRQLKQMYQSPHGQQLKASKSKRKLPRVREKQLFEQKEISNKVFEINQTKRQRIRFKPQKNVPVPLAKPINSSPNSPGFCHILNRLLSRFVFRKNKAKMQTKFIKPNDKATKIYKRSSQLRQKSLQNHRLSVVETEKKLTELWPALVELGELKGPKNPSRLSTNMQYTILKKLSRTALNLPTEYRDLLKNMSTKRSIKHGINSFYAPSKTSSLKIKNLKKQPSLNQRFDFKLGESLKIHDYGFKYLKERASKLDASSRTNMLKKQLIDSTSPREAEAISSKKVFRTMDMSLRRSTRQTAANMFLNIQRSYERKISSKTELVQQLHRLDNLNHEEPNSFDYSDETVSPLCSDLSERLNRTFKRLNQSKANAALTISGINDSPQELLTFDNYEVVHVPLNKKKRQPVKLLRKKQPKSCNRIHVPQADAVTQTECECEICNLLQKYRAEKVPPLVKEMAIKQDFLAHRQYYMENLKHRNFKVCTNNVEKSQNFLGSVIKSPPNDYYTKTKYLCTSIVNLKDTNIYLRGFKRISENYRQLGSPFGIENSKPQIIKAYKKPDVTKNLLQCYKTLFEAEQRTHEIFTNVFYPKENICRA